MLSKFLLDLFFPVLCQGCRVEGSYLCSACQEKLALPQERCPVCEKKSLFGKTHPECQTAAFPLSGLLVSCSYQDESVRSLIRHFKYHSVSDIAEILAVLMTDYVVRQDLTEYFSGSAVVPVPLHKKRLRLRGFNQSELLAYCFAKKLGYEYWPILEKTKNTPRQVDLPSEQRLINIHNAFRLKENQDLQGKKIILVDDVATTGATLKECAKVLTQFQPSEIWALVVARN